MLREHCLNPPVQVRALKAELEQARGRAIQFVPVRTDGRSRCGLWVSAGDTDYILHEQATSPLHSRHIKLHELAHMLWGHQGTSPFAPEFLRLVMPDLDPARVRQVLGRSAYAQVAELEAEMTATMLGEVAAPETLPDEDEERVADHLRRLALALDRPVDRTW
jgi:hypothetical protein